MHRLGPVYLVLVVIVFGHRSLTEDFVLDHRGLREQVSVNQVVVVIAANARIGGGKIVLPQAIQPLSGRRHDNAMVWVHVNWHPSLLV